MSGPFFPDNPNREARVKQLITQTTVIQSTFESAETQIKALTNIEDKVFETLAKAAGYPTAKQYVEAGLSVLSPAQKANYQHMCDNLLLHNPHMMKGMQATAIIAALGFGLKVLPNLVVTLSCKIGAFVHGVWGVLRGLVQIFKGAIQDGVAMVRTFATLIRVNWTRKLAVGPTGDIAAKTASGLLWVKRAGKFLQWAGVIAEAALLVYSLVQGEKDRDTLRAAINECCASRFGAQKLRLLVEQSMLWTSKIAGTVLAAEQNYEDMKEQQANPDFDPEEEIPITQAKIDKGILKSINKLADGFDKELEGCNSDEKVIGDLVNLDAKDSGGSWKNEDPDLEAMKRWIAEHPAKDKDGKVIPMDGPVSGNSGLTWTAAPVKASADGTVVKIVAKNDAPARLDQQFVSLHLSIPILGDVALFSRNNFKIKGTTGDNLGDGTFALETGGGVYNVGRLSIVEKPSSPGAALTYLQFDIDAADVLKPITVPVGASVTFVLQGPTAVVGKASLLSREAWWPAESKDKLWHDCEVVKQ